MCINNIPEKGKICGDRKGKEKKKKEKKVIAGSDHTLISKFGSMLLCIGAILHLPYSSPTESTPTLLILQIQLTVFIHMQLNGSRDHPMLSLPSSLARKLAPIPAHPLDLLHRTPILSLSLLHSPRNPMPAPPSPPRCRHHRIPLHSASIRSPSHCYRHWIPSTAPPSVYRPLDQIPLHRSATDPASSAIHQAATETPRPRMPSIPIYLGLGLGLVFFLLNMLCLGLVFFLLIAWLMWKT